MSVETFSSSTNVFIYLLLISKCGKGSKLIEPLLGKLIVLLSEYEAFTEACCYQVRAQGLVRGRL